MTVENVYSTDTWTCPQNVFSVFVECWAGGMDGLLESGVDGGGTGGKGGDYASAIVPVSPGVTYDRIIGTGYAHASNGGDTYFDDGAVVSATGSGGTTTGSTTYTGGSGGAGSGSGGAGQGGGGGSSAGPSSNGNAGGDAIAGTPGAGGSAVTEGGAGGAGGDDSPNTAGGVGSLPGGGGGGSDATALAAGLGVGGKMRMTYTIMPSAWWGFM